MATVGQALTAIVGVAVTFLPFVNVAWYVGLTVGLSLGGLLFPPSAETPKHDPVGLDFQGAEYGVPIPVLYGTRRFAGNVIWYGNFQEHEHEESAGKGGGSSYSTYTYSVSLAIAVCVGPARIVRAWADKDELIINCSLGTMGGLFKQFDPGGLINILSDTGSLEAHIYDGSQTNPDTHLEQQITGRVPVYKNLCYIVLPNYNLGNSPRIPNFTFEVSSETSEYEQLTTEYGSDAIKPGLSDGQGFIYFVTDYSTDQVKIFKIKEADFSIEDTLVISEPGYVLHPRQCAIDPANGFIYIACDSGASYGHILKVNLSTFTYVDNIYETGGGYVGCAIDVDNQKLYAGRYRGTGDPQSLVKINLSTFAIETYSSGYSSDNYHCISTVVVDTVRSRVYAFYQDHNVANLYSMRSYKTTDMTYVDRIYFYSGWNIKVPTTSGALVDEDRGELYFSAQGDEDLNSRCLGRIVISDPNTIGLVKTIPAPIYNLDVQSMAQDVDFVYYFQVDHGMIKVQKDCFTIVYNVSLPIDLWSTPTAAVVGSDGKIYAYDDNPYCYRVFQAEKDYLPAKITYDMLTNDLYGEGLALAKLDTDVFDATNLYCTEKDFKISLLFKRQLSILDCLSYVISHHNGFISYMGGLIAHGQLSENDTPVETFSAEEDDFLREDAEPVLSVTRHGSRDINNEIIVEYTKRDKDSVKGTARVVDLADVDIYGLLSVNAKLDGITEYSRAYYMAELLLRKSILNPRVFNFPAPPRKRGVGPGEIIEISSSRLEISDLRSRVQIVTEDENYALDITAAEEPLEIFDITVIGEDTSEQPESPQSSGDPTGVVNPLITEFPARYVWDGRSAVCKVGATYSRPDNTSWAGSSIYRSYSEGGSYFRRNSATASGITGTVTVVGDDYIEVLLDYDDSLSSAVSFADLMSTPKMNMFAIRSTTRGEDIFMRFQDATLVSARKWQLSGLIHDTAGFPCLNRTADISVDDLFAMADHFPHVLTPDAADWQKTLYYKIASFNHRNWEQSLADLDAISLTLDALCDKPMPVWGITVGEFRLADGATVVIEAGAITFDWKSRNRYNDGGYTYNRTDAIEDDTDLYSFEIEIYEGTNLLRTIEQTTKPFAKSYTYSTSDQTSDGGPYSSYTIKIRPKTKKHTGEWVTFTVNTV